MATSKQKALWSSSGFQSRTTEDRKAYRAWIKEFNRIVNAQGWPAAQEWRRNNPTPR